MSSSEKSDQRFSDLKKWIQRLAPEAKWQAIAGDASLRRYFRITATDNHQLTEKGKAYIVMDSPVEAGSTRLFADIAGLLRSFSINAPVVIAHQAEQGFMLLEDLGEQMLKAKLGVESGDQLFARVFPVLCQLQKVNAASLPIFSEQKLTEELNLFWDWYLIRHQGYDESELVDKHSNSWHKLSEILLYSALSQPQVFVHRDFHSCNLHVLPDRDLGVIDFQDAVRGPCNYDLISYLWDRNISWDRTSIEKWLLQAKQGFQVEMTDAEWLKSCDYMAIQRNLKILGIFCRLNYRDGKANYLSLLPRFRAHINEVLPLYPELEAACPMLTTWLAIE